MFPLIGVSNVKAAVAAASVNQPLKDNLLPSWASLVGSAGLSTNLPLSTSTAATVVPP